MAAIAGALDPLGLHRPYAVHGIGVVASDAFAVKGDPPEAVRVCLGGPTTLPEMRIALEFMAHALVESPALASSFL